MAAQYGVMIPRVGRMGRAWSEWCCEEPTRGPYNFACEWWKEDAQQGLPVSHLKFQKDTDNSWGFKNRIAFVGGNADEGWVMAENGLSRELAGIKKWWGRKNSEPPRRDQWVQGKSGLVKMGCIEWSNSRKSVDDSYVNNTTIISYPRMIWLVSRGKTL